MQQTLAPSQAAVAAANRREDKLPWWRYGMLWMVMSGPLVVAVAGFITAYIAFTGSDPLVSAEPTGTPAIAARNHAATGVVPAPRASVKP
jgi:hypothetical protein